MATDQTATPTRTTHLQTTSANQVLNRRNLLLLRKENLTLKIIKGTSIALAAAAVVLVVTAILVVTVVLEAAVILVVTVVLVAVALLVVTVALRAVALLVAVAAAADNKKLILCFMNIT